MEEKELVVEEQVLETTTQETTEELNDDLVGNEVVEDTTKEVVEETTDAVRPPVFESMEEWEKEIKSISSKAKNEILKEIGLFSVSDIKEKIAAANTLESIIADNANLKVYNEQLLNDLRARDDKDLLVELEVPQESADLFLKLVNDIDGDIPRVEKGRLVKEKLRGLFKDEVGKIGTPKTSDNEALGEKKQKELREIFKLDH